MSLFVRHVSVLEAYDVGIPFIVCMSTLYSVACGIDKEPTDLEHFNYT